MDKKKIYFSYYYIFNYGNFIKLNTVIWLIISQKINKK